jgi:hypothetical protein
LDEPAPFPGERRIVKKATKAMIARATATEIMMAKFVFGGLVSGSGMVISRGIWDSRGVTGADVAASIVDAGKVTLL